MAVTLKVCISDPMLVKPKWVWALGGSFFQFWKICLQFSAFCLQFFKKTASSQTHFGFANIGSEMHTFRVTAIWSCNFWFGSPCSTFWASKIIRVGDLQHVKEGETQKRPYFVPKMGKWLMILTIGVILTYQFCILKPWVAFFQHLRKFWKICLEDELSWLDLRILNPYLDFWAQGLAFS